MSRTFAAIVPARVVTPDEVRNLCLVLDKLVHAEANEIWCVLQGGAPLSPPEVAGVRTVVVASSKTLLERGRLVNHVLPDTATDLIWIVDPNLILPFAEIAAQLARSAEVAIHPYARRRKPDAPLAEPAAFGKSTFVVEREVLLALGGLSEAFVGPAEDGFELARRLKCFFRDIAAYDHEGVVLRAPKSPLDRAAQRDNKLLLARLADAIATDCERYLAERFTSSLAIDLGRLRSLARTRERQAALRVSTPTPPPCRPQRLPGSIWGITTLFNPAAYRSKRENHRLFRERLTQQGLPLVTVELGFGDAPFELGPGDAERLVQLRSHDVLWQKERLLNVALQHLPEDCDKVVWLDADVLFENPDWVRATAHQLEQVVVVQPFSRSVRLFPGERSIATDDLPLGSDEHELLHGMAYGVFAKGLDSLARYHAHGHSGYAWAARRELLDRHGLYDANVLGNGDLNIAHAMYGGARFLKTERLSDKARRHLEAWATAFHADVGGSVGFVDGTVFHLWHGQKADRRYLDRLEVLITHDYDPDRDLAIDEFGAYRWASDKPELSRFCRDYFFNRREDDPAACASLPEPRAAAPARG